MSETLPLSKIQEAILEFLQGRDDAVLFGAQAVNAYVSEPRMTEDVDVLSTRAPELAEEMRNFLNDKFHIAIGIREIKEKGFRLYQIRKEGNRHLTDIRPVNEFPKSETIENIKVLSPAESVASKVISFRSRFGQPKSWSDRRDLAILLLKFPALKSEIGEVSDILKKREVGDEILDSWREIVAQELRVEDDDDDLMF